MSSPSQPFLDITQLVSTEKYCMMVQITAVMETREQTGEETGEQNNATIYKSLLFLVYSIHNSGLLFLCKEDSIKLKTRKT